MTTSTTWGAATGLGSTQGREHDYLNQVDALESVKDNITRRGIELSTDITIDNANNARNAALLTGIGSLAEAGMKIDWGTDTAPSTNISSAPATSMGDHRARTGGWI